MNDDPTAAAQRQAALPKQGERKASRRQRKSHIVRIGSREMMAGQLARLAREISLPSVSLGIIPVTAARTMWSSPGFWMFDDARVLVETPAAELAITQPREIVVYLRTFRELAAMAVYGSHARELVSRAATDLR